MGRTDASDRNTTSPRDSNDLTQVIDGSGGAGRIAGKRRELFHTAIWFPHRCAELQSLQSRVARRVLNTVLCPANDFPAAIHRRGIAVESTRKRRKRGHSAVGPAKTITDFSC